MIKMLSNIRIVLVNTSHPGNIGAAARAMKTMGLSELYLVAPKVFPHVNADEMASSALDVLGQAKIVETMEQAIADCSLVVGTSARSRSIPWPMLSPREFAEKAALQPRDPKAGSKIAVVFGREQSGLTNEELQCCHFHIQIPSNPAYSSLNIAAAVQVIAYELRVASEVDSLVVSASHEDEYVSANDMHGFYEHLEKTLVQIDFLDPKVPRQLMPRLQRLFNRLRLERMELNILRGILTAISKSKNNV
jgi:tRNA (cytidine32/uridine32-2'-O)-methyltransferase